jgi:hypothetical protein
MELFAKSAVSGDQGPLRHLAFALKRYHADSGDQIPADLAPLRDYVDLPRLLRPDTDPHGPFQDRYAFLPAKPWVELAGEAPRQILLISVKPFKDGSRGAIWRYAMGEYEGGMITATELRATFKDFDFKSLRPMGGGVPAPSQPFLDPPLTDYQRRVMQAVREGKMVALPARAVASYPAVSNGHNSPVIWPWVAGCTVVACVAAVVWKRRRRSQVRRM